MYAEVLVVSFAAPYYKEVFDIIRKNAMSTGTWSDEDESGYQESIKTWEDFHS